MENIRLFSNPYEHFGELTTVQTLLQEHLKVGSKRLCIESHPGTGKTVTGLYFVYYFNQPAIVLCTRCQINSQWKDAAKTVLFPPDNKKFILLESQIPLSNKIVDSYDLIICTPEKLLNAINRGNFDYSRIKTAVYDEAHNFFTERRVEIFNKFENQLLLSATFPKDFYGKKYAMFKKFFNKPIRPLHVDKVIAEVPVHFIETLACLNRIKTDDEKIVKDRFLNILFNTKLNSIFKTPAKVLITTRLIASWVMKFCNILKILINNNIKSLPLRFCLLRSANNYSYYVDLADIDKVSLESYLRDAIKKLVNSPDDNNNVNHMKVLIRDEMSKISSTNKISSKSKALELTENYLLGNYSNIEFENNLKGINLSMSYRLRQLCNEYVKLHEIEEKDDNTTIDTILQGLTNFSSNVIKTKTPQDIIKKANIILSTNLRVQEGFNCEEIVLGYFNDFTFSYTARIQILGRIRRKQNNVHKDFIHNFPRYAYCVINNPLKKVLDNKVFYTSQYMEKGGLQGGSQSSSQSGLRSSSQSEQQEYNYLQLYRKIYQNNFNYENEQKVLQENNYKKLNDLSKEEAFNYSNGLKVSDKLAYYREYRQIFDIGSILKYINEYLTNQ